MDTVNSMVNVRGKGQWGEVEGKGRLNGDGRKFGAVNTQYTNDIFQNCIPETCRILLTNAVSINSIKKKRKKKDGAQKINRCLIE